MRRKKRESGFMSPVEGLGLVGYVAPGPVRGVLAETLGAAVAEGDAESHIRRLAPREPIEQQYLTIFLALTVARPLLPRLAEYLKVEPQETGEAFARAVADRWVPTIDGDAFADVYDIARQHYVACRKHPDNFGGERLGALRRLYRACYPAIDWDDARLELWGTMGLLEQPLLFAAEVFRDEVEANVDWSLDPTEHSPVADEWVATLVRAYDVN